MVKRKVGRPKKKNTLGKSIKKYGLYAKPKKKLTRDKKKVRKYKRTLTGEPRLKKLGYYKGDKVRKGKGRKVTKRSRQLDRKRDGSKYESWE